MSLQPCAGIPAFPTLGLERRPCGMPAPGSRCPTCDGETSRLRERNRGPVRGNFRQRGYDAEYDRNRRIVLAEEDTCWRCGLPGSDDDPLTAGHVVSIAEGGTNDRDNLHAEHASCNSIHGGALGGRRR